MGRMKCKAEFLYVIKCYVILFISYIIHTFDLHFIDTISSLHPSISSHHLSFFVSNLQVANELLVYLKVLLDLMR